MNNRLYSFPPCITFHWPCQKSSKVSELKKIDLTFFIFLFYFIFILLLDLELEFSVTQCHI